MIARLSGKIWELTSTYVVLNCGGVGYLAQISLSSHSELQGKETADIFTRMIVREDAMLLFGFVEEGERHLFDLLIGVNGVGPSSALGILSSLDRNIIEQAIRNEDAKTIQSVKGIGAKTAQRIIIDLKDKLSEEQLVSHTSFNLKNKIKFDALMALEVLGIPKPKAEQTIDALLNENQYDSVETLVKDALKKQR